MAKQKYLADKVDIVKNNSKSLWKLLNQITNRKRKKQTVISHLKINNNEAIYDPKLIADKLNEYFVTVGHNLVNYNL